ncbi:MAG TPA: hypothetical protein VHS78_10050 [Candidatus Elarobacter sp.]|jgi:hypothetical protein|nr:hypothetical protein [Candidatus Elarobacter sp.]
MALVPDGPTHTVAGVIAVQIMRDDAQNDPAQAFSAQIDVPSVPQQTLPLHNGSSLSFPVHTGNINGTVRAEVDDFTLQPNGTSPADATGLTCKIVFKLQEIFTITLGSVNVTASLKAA